MDKPRIDNAPGITYRPTKHGWLVRWRARRDLVARKYSIKSLRIWESTARFPEPTEMDIKFIQDRCQALQDDMLQWARGDIPTTPSSFDGTISSLIHCYQSDKDSAFGKTRFRTRRYYRSLCNNIERTMYEGEKAIFPFGEMHLRDVRTRVILRLHETWSATGKTSMAHSTIRMLRMLIGYGVTMLEDPECVRLSAVLRQMRFKMSKPREARLTADQATEIRRQAHASNLSSIALAQAFQFECTFRQRDVIGEWVPTSEKTPPTEIISGNEKWLRGIRWSEIDANMRLTHVTSKRQKEITIDLRNAPMVLEELDIAFPGWGGDRSKLPASGPIIIAERYRMPWGDNEFRRKWRQIADKAGVPKGVRNMDTRAGAISEATDAGANLEHVRQAATHSDISMTQRYSRGSEEKVAGVMQLRAAHRRKNETGTK